MLLRVVCVLVLVLDVIWTDQKCQPRKYNFDSIVCVCNATYCDTIESPTKLNSSSYLVYTSSAAGLRFEKTMGHFEPPDFYINGIFIDRTIQFQEILGFGGAFTDSTGINIATLDNSTQNNLLNAYFGSDGIQYNMGRIPIGGTDFSLRGYTYDDGILDPELKNFKLQPEDYHYKIPFLKKALELTEGALTLFASAWSPPRWMKTDNSLDAFAAMLKRDMFQPWANYHLKFVQEYEKRGLKIWGITTGNEPATAFVTEVRINRLGWSIDLMHQWISQNLGPTLKANYPNITIMIVDDQRYLLPWIIQFLVTNSSNQYIDGIAIHWYYDYQQFSTSLLRDTHKMYPDKFILNTEGSVTNGRPAVALGSWHRGERYSYCILEDLSNWVTGWVDWNLVLDLNGGPTWEHNYLDAAIIVNSTSGEFYKQPIFYHLGHFSKFVLRGSKKIYSKTDYKDHFHVIAFERPDGAIVVIILNRRVLVGEWRSEKIVPISIFDSERGVAKIGIDKKSINTILYW